MEYVCKLAWWMYRIVKDQIRKHPTILIPAEEVQPVFNEIHDFFQKDTLGLKNHRGCLIVYIAHWGSLSCYKEEFQSTTWGLNE